MNRLRKARKYRRAASETMAESNSVGDKFRQLCSWVGIFPSFGVRRSAFGVQRSAFGVQRHADTFLLRARGWAERRETNARRGFCARDALEVGPGLESEPTGVDHGRKRTYLSIIRLSGVVEIAARYSNPIFRSFDLGLKITKITVCFQLWIPFAHRQEPTQRAGDCVLCLFKLSKLFGVSGSLRRIDRYLGCVCTGVDDVGQCRLLEISSSLDRPYKVGYQIRSPLILCLHLRPGRIDRRGGPHQPIVATRESQDEADNHNKYYSQATETENDGFVHGVIKISKHWRTENTGLCPRAACTPAFRLRILAKTGSRGN